MKWSDANTAMLNFDVMKPSIFYKLKAEAFEDLSAHPFYCEDCRYFTELKDKYGTGDSEICFNPEILIGRALFAGFNIMV